MPHILLMMIDDAGNSNSNLLVLYPQWFDPSFQHREAETLKSCHIWICFFRTVVFLPRFIFLRMNLHQIRSKGLLCCNLYQLVPQLRWDLIFFACALRSLEVDLPHLVSLPIMTVLILTCSLSRAPLKINFYLHARRRQIC